MVKKGDRYIYRRCSDVCSPGLRSRKHCQWICRPGGPLSEMPSTGRASLCRSWALDRVFFTVSRDVNLGYLFVNYAGNRSCDKILSMFRATGATLKVATATEWSIVFEEDGIRISTPEKSNGTALRKHIVAEKIASSALIAAGGKDRK